MHENAYTKSGGGIAARCVYFRCVIGEVRRRARVVENTKKSIQKYRRLCGRDTGRGQEAGVGSRDDVGQTVGRGWRVQKEGWLLFKRRQLTP